MYALLDSYLLELESQASTRCEKVWAPRPRSRPAVHVAGGRMLWLLFLTSGLVTGRGRAPPRALPSAQRMVAPSVPFGLRPAAAALEVLSMDSYVMIAGAQACGLASAADAASQAALLGTVDPHHVAAMGTLAFTVSGSLNALWLQFLEEKTPGASFQACASKTACDFACCATLFNSAYLGFVPVLTALYAGVAFDEAWALCGWTKAGFQSAMMLEAITFTPYNMIAFRAVPPRLRPLSSALLSATCAIVVSGLTLGIDWLQ